MQLLYLDQARQLLFPGHVIFLGQEEFSRPCLRVQRQSTGSDADYTPSALSLHTTVDYDSSQFLLN